MSSTGHNRQGWPSLRILYVLLLQLFLCLSSVVGVAAFGGEKPFFTTSQVTHNVSHRQFVCDRYEKFWNGSVELRDALEGFELHAVLGSYEGAYFNYDPVNGIDKRDPGLIPVILDELGRRAKFTWRDSFGVYYNPQAYGSDWNETLHWSIETYDLSCDWWMVSLERLHAGAVFTTEWLDASNILVRKMSEEDETTNITFESFFNWLKPYSTPVWLMTLFTIFISGVVYQILEWYDDDRQDRSMWEWWSENAYLSFINSTQAYEYQPKSLAGRIFGVSSCVWALVMTATYTANLASLLVDRRAPAGPQTIEEIAVFGSKVCTWEGTQTDLYLEKTFPSAKRIPKETMLEVYQALHNGDCDFVADTVSSFNRHKGLRQYNPQCDLLWVGGDRTFLELVSAFAINADSGHLCTGFIRDVINLHMREMIEDGFIEDAWKADFKKTQTIDCDTYRPEFAAISDPYKNNTPGGRNLQGATSHDYHSQQRSLKAVAGASGGAVASMSSSDEGNKLTLQQMIGTFVCHYGFMVIAIAIAHFTAYYTKYGKKQTKKVTKAITKSVRRTFSFDGTPGTPLEAMAAAERVEVEAPPANHSKDDDNTAAQNNLQNEVALMREEQRELRQEQRELRQHIQDLVEVVSLLRDQGVAAAASRHREEYHMDASTFST